MDSTALTMRPMTADAADLDRFAACFAKNSAPKRAEVLRWQYADNPTGKLFVDLAVAPEARLAAIYATQPVRLRIDGEVVLGVQSVDTITDADFRGRGLFVKLAKQTYARAAEAGAKLVYGFPNGSSAHGFFERLDWTSLDPVPFLIRPLRSSFVLDKLGLAGYGRYLPNLPLFAKLAPTRGTVVPVSSFDERATRLWHAHARGVGVAVERDARYLSWRLGKPGEHYHTEAIADGNDFAALASHAVKEKHGGRVGYLMEGLCAPGRGRALRSLLSRALQSMMREGADVALAWCLPHSPTYTSYLRLGFVPFPEKYRPIELHFGAAAFEPRFATTIRDRASWYLSYLDSDTV